MIRDSASMGSPASMPTFLKSFASIMHTVFVQQVLYVKMLIPKYSMI